jgi:alcohol dehydrogenase class IV
VISSLDDQNIPHAVFSRVTPNPRADEVMEGAEYYKQEGCDIIVSVGGGSPTDCAKGIGIVSSNNGYILDFEGVDRIPFPMPPVICIPTTGGTSADVSQFAIITDRKKMTKIAIISKAVVPDVSLIDPTTLTTMDPYLTACTGIDALVHAIEAYVSTGSSPITDIHAREAVRLISGNLLDSIKNPDDIELRSRVMRGSLVAGLAFSNASLGAVHAMAHSLGGLLDLPHGECNAVLLDHVMAFNLRASPERYMRIAKEMGLDLRGMNTRNAGKAVINEIRHLKREAGIYRALTKLGVSHPDIPDLASNAMKDACMVTNPVRPNQRDIEVIYEEAL